MIRLLERMLERRRTVYLACAATLAIGLFFIFVRAPHPWGMEGFDHYHELALTLASGHAFPTMDVPWGYAYFLAAFYRLFGDHPSIPLTAQALLNALMPLLVFRLATGWFDRRTAALAALLTGVFSFNTVYASTQSSDAVCTVIFTTAILAFVRALDGGGLIWYALAGGLTGIASQFRPNLVLIPLLLAVYAFFRTGRRVAPALAVVLCATAVLAPWIVRNYALTRMLVPTSVHSGMQLWYGSLQVGRYLDSRAYNPRALFESGVFDYTSLDHVPLVVTVSLPECPPAPAPDASLVYWTSRDPEHRIARARIDGRVLAFEAPAPEAPAVFYYYVTASWPLSPPLVRSIPLGGTAAPLVYFINNDHLGDLDLNEDLLDVFDLVRMMRRAAWDEPLQWADKLDAAGFRDAPLEAAVQALTRRFDTAARTSGPMVKTFVHNDREAVLTLGDESTLTVPRSWDGRVTEIAFSGGLAAALMSSTVRLAAPPERAAPASDECLGLGDVEVNNVFYRREPHLMRRYTVLALDNIRRDPAGFAMAAAFRTVRLFIVWGSGDRATTQQFERSRAVSAVATVLSALFVGLFIAGAVVSWRRGRPVLLPLLLILYVPATIAPMLTNMRYTITVQPLMFMFMAAALTRLVEGRPMAATPEAARDREGTRTAPRP